MMIDQDTVFILGAGASKNYGYPTGLELRRLISEKFPKIVGAYLYVGQDNQKMAKSSLTLKRARELAIVFSKSATQSIDLFLARNPEYEDIGKMSIIVSIFEAEFGSGFNESSISPERDWYFYLFNRLTDELTKPDDFKRYADNKVKFITFNYDRSLEHYLYDSFYHSYYSKMFEQPAKHEDVMPFEIIHIYGKVAPLPWQDNKNGLGYGLNRKDKEHRLVVEELTENIRVIYSRVDDSIERAKEIIKNTNRLFFVGFGFAKENLEVLGLPANMNVEQEIYGTALGMTDREIDKLKKLIYYRISGNRPTINMDIQMDKIKIEKMDCRQLIREYL